MKREIKFRAWDKENGCWASINSIVLCDDGSIAYLLPEEDDMPPYLEEEVEIMQYIGLKDMNGVDIYEGDIVLRLDNPKEKPALVMYVSEGARFVIDRISFYQPIGEFRYEVIGNKFENPELLEDN